MLFNHIKAKTASFGHIRVSHSVPSCTTHIYKMISVTTVACLLLCISNILAMPYELVENEDGEAFAMVPINRVRRQAAKQPIFKNKNHQVEGSFEATRPNGLRTYDGRVGYTHIPTGSKLDVGASHTRGYGTGVGAEGTYNIIHDKRNSLGATGHYSRHFGGPYGTGRPNYGVGLKYEYRF